MSMQKILGATLFMFAVSTLISQSAMDLLASLFFIFFVVWAGNRSEIWRELLETPGKWVAGLWFLSFAVSALFNFETRAWLKLFDFRWLILAAMVGVFLKKNPLSKRALCNFAGVFLFCCLYAILVFILKFNPVAPNYALDRLADGTLRTGGFLIQPIVFSHLYVLWMCIFLGLVLVSLDESMKNISDKNNLWLIFVLVVASFALLLSFTRGAWIAMFGATILMCAFLRPRWALVTLGLSVLAFGILFLTWPTLHGRFLEAFVGESERKWIWRANWQMFLDHPVFGVGYGQNPNLLEEYYRKMGSPTSFVSHAHNQYLHILAGNGFVGFIFYSTFWIFATKMAWESFRRHYQKKSWFAGFALGVLGVLICYLLGGLTESNLEHSKIRYTLSLAFGLLFWITRA